jgi:CBS domain-containing protein
MLLKDILAVKGKTVFTIEVDARVSDALQELLTHNIGSLVVCQGDAMIGISLVVCQGDAMIGIITERDILRTVAELGQPLEDVRVTDRMNAAVISGVPEDDVDKVMGLMTEKRIRHLPVLDQGKLAGLVSLGDVVKAQHQRLTMENQQLINYIQS